MAARVEAKAKENGKDGGVWVSANVREDVETVRAPKHLQLKWKEHPDEELKGFQKRYTLWSVKE